MAYASSALTVVLPSTHCVFRFRGKRFAVCARKNHDDGKRSDGSHDHYGGRLVDENMVTLRRRIHEMRIAESCRDDGVNEAPADWMEWERRYYKRYGSDVSEVVGMVQALLMNARPGAGLAAVAVVGLSLPAAMAMLLLNLLAMH